jgi:hypothetical protein
VKSLTSPPLVLAVMVVLFTVGAVLFAGAAVPDKMFVVLAIPLGLLAVLGTWRAPAAATLVLVALIGFDSSVLLPEALRGISPFKLLFSIPLLALVLGKIIGRFPVQRPHPLDRWLVGWTALNLVLCFVAQDKAAALDFCRRWLGLVLLYWLISRLFTDKGKYEHIRAGDQRNRARGLGFLHRRHCHGAGPRRACHAY